MRTLLTSYTRKIISSKAFLLSFLFLAVFLFGAYNRFLFIKNIEQHPTLNILLPKTDPFIYDFMARNLLSEKPLEVRMPAYPLYVQFLKYIYQFFGQHYSAAYFSQYALSLISVLLLVACGYFIFGWPAGLIGGALLLFYKLSYIYDVILTDTSLSQFLIILSLFFFCLYQIKQKWLFYVFFIISGILLCLLRVHFWVLLSLCLIFFFVKGRQWESKLYVMTLFLAFFLSLVLFHKYHTVETYAHKFGFHFFIGNHAHSMGLLETIPEIRPHAEGFAKDSLLWIYKQTGEHRLPSAFWFKKTLSSYEGRPWRMLKVWLNKLLYLTNDYEPHNVTSAYYFENKSKLKDLFNISFAFIFAPAVLAMLFMFRERRVFFLSIVILYLIGSLLMVFYSDRYRLPLIPFLCLMAGWGYGKVTEALINRQRRSFVLYLILLAVLVLWSFQPIEIFDKQQDMAFWNNIERLQLDYQKRVIEADEKLRNWAELSTPQKVSLIATLRELELHIKFFKYYEQVFSMADLTREDRIKLLMEKISTYDLLFDFHRALETCLELWQYPEMRDKTVIKMRELELLGLMLHRNF